MISLAVRDLVMDEPGRTDPNARKSKIEWISPDQPARVNLVRQSPCLGFTEASVIKVLAGTPAALWVLGTL